MSVHVQLLPCGDVTVGRRLDHGYGVTTTQLRFTAAEWEQFVAGVRAGEFDVDDSPARSESTQERPGQH